MPDKQSIEAGQLPLTRFLADLREWIKGTFQFAEWLLIVVAFQYVGKRFRFVAADVVGIVLGVLLGIHVGLAIGRLVVRFVDLPFRSKTHEIAVHAITISLATAIGEIVIFITKEMISAQLLGAH